MCKPVYMNLYPCFVWACLFLSHKQGHGPTSHASCFFRAWHELGACAMIGGFALLPYTNDFGGFHSILTSHNIGRLKNTHIYNILPFSYKIWNYSNSYQATIDTCVDSDPTKPCIICSTCQLYFLYLHNPLCVAREPRPLNCKSTHNMDEWRRKHN